MFVPAYALYQVPSMALGTWLTLGSQNWSWAVWIWTLAQTLTEYVAWGPMKLFCLASSPIKQLCEWQLLHKAVRKIEMNNPGKHKNSDWHIACTQQMLAIIIIIVVCWISESFRPSIVLPVEGN